MKSREDGLDQEDKHVRYSIISSNDWKPAKAESSRSATPAEQQASPSYFLTDEGDLEATIHPLDSLASLPPLAMSGLYYGTYGASTTLVIIGLCMRDAVNTFKGHSN